MKVALKSTKNEMVIGGVKFKTDQVTVTEETPELLYWISVGTLERTDVEIPTDAPGKVVNRKGAKG